MADLNKKFLDYGGLSIFLSKLQEYIADRITEINGSNVNAFEKDADNPLHLTDPDKYKTISSQLQALWEAIGVGGDGNLSITDKIENIIGEYVKSVKTSNGNTGTKYVTISPNTATKDNVTITIDDTVAKEKFESIDNYTINGKKISTSPTITGDDVTLGKSVGDNTNYPTTMDIPEAIQKLRETIAGLGQVMELKGILTSLPTNTSGYENGDVVIVGNKEYVCYNSAWYLIGDVTELAGDVETLISKYNSHKHSVTAKGSIESTFTGNASTTSSITGKADVSYITKAGTLPTTTSKTVASKDHTHTTSVTAKGSIESTFTGTAASHGHTFEGNSNTTSSNGGTATYSAGKLTISFGHTHTVTPTGTVKNTSITPTGTVASTFTGEAVSCTSGAPSASTEFNAVSSVGTLPTYTNIEVASKDHTHTVTPTGTVASTFTSEAVTTGTTDSPM